MVRSSITYLKDHSLVLSLNVENGRQEIDHIIGNEFKFSAKHSINIQHNGTRFTESKGYQK